MLNLDTHIFIHALNGKLTGRERQLLSEKNWSISAIVIWEITKLAQLGRIELDIHSAYFARVLSQVRVWPLDLEVCRHTAELDFRGDPADEIIAATSLAHRIPLLTRDKSILKSKVVPLARLPDRIRR